MRGAAPRLLLHGAHWSIVMNICAEGELMQAYSRVSKQAGAFWSIVPFVLVCPRTEEALTTDPIVM